MTTDSVLELRVKATLIFIVDFSELGVNPIHYGRVESIYQRGIFHSDETGIYCSESLNIRLKEEIMQAAA
jgi:hypothetical protein